MNNRHSDQWPKDTSSLLSSASESSVSSGSVPVGGDMGTIRHATTATGSDACGWGCPEEG